MLQYLFRLTAGRQEQDPGEKDLKVEDINTKLNELAAAGSAEEKTAVLQWVVQRSSARMLKWITQIILKDLKVKLTQSCKDLQGHTSVSRRQLLLFAIVKTPFVQGLPTLCCWSTNVDTATLCVLSSTCCRCVRSRQKLHKVFEIKHALQV